MKLKNGGKFWKTIDAAAQSRTGFLILGLLVISLFSACSKGVSNSASTPAGNSPVAAGVTVTPPNASLYTLASQQFTAAVENSTNHTVTWKVDSVVGGNATVGRITTDGLYTAPAAAGSHTVMAISVGTPTKSGSVRVTVSVPTLSVRVSPTDASISTIAAQQFTATVEYGTNTAVIWKVDGVVGGNASAGRISTEGLYTPPPSPGAHTVSASSVQAPSKSASVPVVVSLLSGVLTYHNDNARTGRNLQERLLTPANVKTATFGKLFSYYVDGYVYAQPLYVANVPINGRLRNVVYVATEHNSVYAFDAENGEQLWQVSFIDPVNGITTVPYEDTASPPGYTGPGPVRPGGCTDLTPEIGITGTPVIDPATGTLYVVAKTKEVSGTTVATVAYEHRLHALNIINGQIRPGSGRALQASVPGTTEPNDGNGRVLFKSLRQNQRPALLLNNNVITVAFSSHCVIRPYQGWVLAYDATTLNQVGVFNVSPNNPKGKGGIWHSGGGPAADGSGNVFVMTGDGPFDVATGGSSYSDSVLKLTNGSLTLSDYFTPFNHLELEAANADMSAGAPMLLPEQPGSPPLMLSLGKQGVVYLLNRDNLGKYQADSDSQIVQSFVWSYCGAGNCLIFGGPAYFENKVYMAAVTDRLKAYSLINGRFSLTPAESTNIFRWPGASPVISANGSSNGIVWALETNGSGEPAVLHAYAADDVSNRLYHSNENALRDNPGAAIKFSVPIIANGRVYVGSQFQVSVFGLLP